MSQAVDGLATAAFWIMAAGFILLLVGLALGPLYWDKGNYPLEGGGG